MSYWAFTHMSEIFDFLKKTEAERRKKIPVPETVPSLPSADLPVSANRTDEVRDEPISVEAQICRVEEMDLTHASPEVRTVLDPITLVGEQFRLLRSRLDLMQKQRGIKKILVTSTVPEEGKTFTASCLAGLLAQEPGKRIVLVDADMRKPKSGWSLGLNGSLVRPGLSEVLRGEINFHNALLTFANPEFCYLPSGQLPSNPSELLSSPMLESALKTAAENFDWVILDSPPITSLSDTVLLAPLCDAVLLVVRAGSTPSKLVKEAANQVGRDRICGVVLNRQKQMNSSRYYYQYYYRSSSKDKK
jgi:protein-tyrosine kinase